MNEIAAVNEVRVVGRLSREPENRELPSGDVMVSFNVVVERPAKERGSVDSIECVTTRVGARRAVERLAPGDVVEVCGALRRRFWRGPVGVQSRYAVDAASVRRLSPRTRARPDPRAAS